MTSFLRSPLVSSLRRTAGPLLLGLTIACHTPSSPAQSATTSLRGTVTDNAGATLSSAHVTLDDPTHGTHLERTTSTTGEYTFPQLAPGTYTLTVDAPGFTPQHLTRQLLVSQPATENVTLGVAEANAEVSVEAETTALNTTDASIGDAVSGQTITTLPIEGRNVPDLLSLQPGVLYLGRNINQSFDSRSGAVAGSRSDQGNITLDGVDNNTEVQGYGFTGVLRSTLDSVGEFRVTTTGSEADTGRSSGAQVNLVTRSGTNSFHGTLYEYNRNTRLSANNWFNKQAELLEGQPNTPGKLIRNTFGASLGGPLLHDKLFFFGNYEGQRTAENQQVTEVVPTAAFRQGIFSYLTPDGSQASGTRTVTLTPQQFSSMDPRCSATGACPLGPGANPRILALLQTYPLPNGNVAGNGLNTASYTFSAPNPINLNTGVTRFDWSPSTHHQLFIRGVLQDDTTLATPQFSQQPASSRTRDNTKGLAAGDTWTVSPSVVNNLRYGYARQSYSIEGTGEGTYVNFGPGTISSPVAQTRYTAVSIPVHNFVDDLTWTHGRHTFQFGVNDRLIHNSLASDALSYDSAAMVGYDVTESGFANTGQSFDPTAFALPAVDPSFVNSYNFDVANLAGIISQVTNQYNYTVSPSGATGTLAAPGAIIAHTFRSNELEYYLQDNFRPRPNLTLTFGVRHLLAQTPFEVNGQQAQPTIDVHQWFLNRAAAAAVGSINQPYLSFAPSGQARGLKPFWPMALGNVAPRVSIAYAPDNKTSIRAGFGIFYDHFGQGVVSSFSQFGSYGLQGIRQTPNDTFSPDNAPRFTGLNNIPSVNGVTPTTVTYPFAPSADPSTTGFATAVGLDDHLQTPYSYTMDLSLQRQLPSGFSLEVAYVGRLGRHLLQQTDLAAPLDFVDPKSGQDFNTAASTLIRQVNAGATSVQPIPYFENLFPDAANRGADGSGTPGASATQNIYTNLFIPNPVNSSYIRYALDILCSPGCGGRQGGGSAGSGRFYNPQFNSLFAWTSNGTSNYNALQLILRHPTSHGIQADFSYTFSKSLDLGSDAERTCVQCGSNAGSVASYIPDAFSPSLNYGPSDFDTRHLITADWVLDLPAGRGRRFLSSASRAVDAVLGGWQLTGLARWTSGLPFTVIAGNAWQNDWSKESFVVKSGPVKTRTHLDENGAPQVFDNPSALLAGIGNGGPIQNPLPGQSGSRNAFRGDGYFGVDAGLAKYFTTVREQRLRLSWEVFNVSNSVRFDVNPLTSLQNYSTNGSFGVYSQTLTAPRVQQISARYIF